MGDKPKWGELNFLGMNSSSGFLLNALLYVLTFKILDINRTSSCSKVQFFGPGLFIFIT